jgi:hypothetical protein
LVPLDHLEQIHKCLGRLVLKVTKENPVLLVLIQQYRDPLDLLVLKARRVIVESRDYRDRLNIKVHKDHLDL